MNYSVLLFCFSIVFTIPTIFYPCFFLISSLATYKAALSRTTYSRYIPLNFKYFRNDILERDFVHKYGMPFSYKEIGDKYPYFDISLFTKTRTTPIIADYRKLLVVYISKSSDRKGRDQIRHIMRKYRHLSISYCFAISTDLPEMTNLMNEYSLYQDFLLFSHHDSYKNLTISVLSFLNYFAHHNVADFILKTDTDCVINFKKLMLYLNELSSNDHIYAGNCACGEGFTFKRVTDPPRKAIPRNYVIPCYSYGAGYLLSMKSLPSLMIAVRHLDYLLINEDVNIGKAWSLLGYECRQVHNWLLHRPTNMDIDKYYIVHTKSNMSLVNMYYELLI